jgi:molybdopterin synthase catalytic subunit
MKGMANFVCEIVVTESTLQTPDRDVDVESGAVVDFFGVVRRLEDGREIQGIDYEAHVKMAEHQMRLIAKAAAAKFQLKRVVLHHRIGFVGVGEASLFLRVGASHRRPAFDASKWIVDELKKRVPIWKKVAFSKTQRCSDAPAARLAAKKRTARRALATS